MPRDDETTFVVHGLEEDNRIVRAIVFAQKFRQLLSCLQTSDKLANGRTSFEYVITKLETTHSAGVTIREKQKRRAKPFYSSIAYFEKTAVAVYNGDRNLDRQAPALVRQIQRLTDGVARKFSHAEIEFSDETVIRIDDFLERQAEIAYEVATVPQLKPADKFYRGIAVGAFDGELKEIDSRGMMLRGKLILSTGGAEIDCVMNKDRIPDARESFDKRVVVEGAAHYDGVSQIPSRIDVRNIKIIREGNLLRWRGAFRPIGSDDADEDW